MRLPFLEYSVQIIRLIRLAEVVVHSSFETTYLVFDHRIGRYRNDGKVCER